MIFKTALKYKIWEWALDSIFNKIIKNFASHTLDLPLVRIFKTSGLGNIESGYMSNLICETRHMGKTYRASVSLEIVQDIISAFGYNTEETAGEVAVIFSMEFYDQIEDVYFLYTLEDSIYFELREYFKNN